MGKLRIIAQYVEFLVARQKWWLWPIAAALLILGGILVFGQGSPAGPFIYTLF